MNTNSLKQQQILGGHETNAEMWNSPYSDTGSTDGTVAGNSINGSLDRTANYVASYLEADRPVEKLRKQGALGLFAFAGAAVGGIALGTNSAVVEGVLGSGGFTVVVAVVAMIAVACMIAGIVKFRKAGQIAKVIKHQKKELEKQAQQNISLSSTNTEKEFKYKQQMAEKNLMATSNINDVKNQSRQITANAGLLEQSLNYANLGHNLATAMESFSDIDGDNIQDAKKNLQNVKLFGLESARINKSFGSLKS